MQKIKAGICLEIILMGLVVLLYFFVAEPGPKAKENEGVQSQKIQAGQEKVREEIQTETVQTENVQAEGQAAEDGQEAEEAQGTEETLAQPIPTLSDSLIQYAEQFIGNPYVWGGTSLTEGADCSGFVQTVYEEFGILLPRTSREQAMVGEQIAVEEARPGDLIFYAKEGEVYHVVIYTGDGQSVQAKSQEAGITLAPVDYDHAVWAVRVM